MTYAERKWKASEEKVRFAKSFPPLLKRKDDAKRALKTERLRFGELIIYDDYRFTFEPLDENDVPKFLSNLRESRRFLYEHHREHYDKFDELDAMDKELTRLARFEKLLGAIVNNALAFPELIEAIPKCLANPDAPAESHLPPNPDPKAVRLLNALRDNLPEMPELLDEAPKVLKGESALVECDRLKRFANREA